MNMISKHKSVRIIKRSLEGINSDENELTEKREQNLQGMGYFQKYRSRRSG
jgi:hypothetical protein